MEEVLYCLRAGCCDAMRSRGPDALALAFWVSGTSSENCEVPTSAEALNRY